MIHTYLWALKVDWLNFLVQVLAQEVAAKQPDDDKVFSAGKNILQLAHPQAVPILDGKLQQLEKKWLDLRGKLGRCPYNQYAVIGEVLLIYIESVHA